MLAASYWSLLAPAIAQAETDPRYGEVEATRVGSDAEVSSLLNIPFPSALEW